MAQRFIILVYCFINSVYRRICSASSSGVSGIVPSTSGGYFRQKTCSQKPSAKIYATGGI